MARWGVKLWTDEYVEVEADTEDEAIDKAKRRVDFYVSDVEATNLDEDEDEE